MKILKGKAGLTTGGLSGIGGAIVNLFASNAAGFVVGTHLLVEGGLLASTSSNWGPQALGLLDANLREHLR